jgi:hypothetical protein
MDLRSIAFEERVPVLEDQLELLAAATARALDDDREVGIALRGPRRHGAVVSAEGPPRRAFSRAPVDGTVLENDLDGDGSAEDQRFEGHRSSVDLEQPDQHVHEDREKNRDCQ